MNPQVTAPKLWFPEMVPATASLGQCMAGTVPFAEELGMDLPQCVSLAYV